MLDPGRLSECLDKVSRQLLAGQLFLERLAPAEVSEYEHVSAGKPASKLSFLLQTKDPRLYAAERERPGREASLALQALLTAARARPALD